MNNQKHTKAPIDLNFPTLPFYKLTKRPSNKPEVYENADKSIGIGFFKGMPTTNAQKILTYLLSKAPRKDNGEIDIKMLREKGIKWTYAEICNYLRNNNETRNRRTIKDDMTKLGSITLHLHTKYIVKQGSESMEYTNIRSRGLFEVSLYDENSKHESSNQIPLWQNTIKFDDIILDNLENKVFRLYDVGEVQKIQSPVAIRIHGIINLHNQSKNWKIGLIKLANQIPIQIRVKKRTKQVIKHACEELIELGLLECFDIYQNQDNEEIIQFTFK